MIGSGKCTMWVFPHTFQYSHLKRFSNSYVLFMYCFHEPLTKKSLFLMVLNLTKSIPGLCSGKSASNLPEFLEGAHL